VSERVLRQQLHHTELTIPPKGPDVRDAGIPISDVQLRSGIFVSLRSSCPSSGST
jgi:hypothetical protein